MPEICVPYIQVGISIINGLMIVKDNIGNKYIESQFDQVIRMVRNGTSLSQSIQKIDGFDAKLASSIYIGEESGKLEDMLSSLADDFDYEAEMATQKMVAMLEPIMIIFFSAHRLMCYVISIITNLSNVSESNNWIKSGRK